MSDRDQHVDRLLREAMTGSVRAESADCLDVETLAAWSEGSLRADERGRAEAHAAACTRCQSMLAAMIRTEPVVAAAAAPSPFRKWLVMLGPAVGVAAAVTLWIAIDRPTSDRVPAQVTAALEKSAPPADQDKRDTKEGEAAGASSSPAAPAESLARSADPTAALRARETDKAGADANEPKREAAEAPKLLDSLAEAKPKSMGGSIVVNRRAEASDSRVAGAVPPVAAAAPPPPAAPEPPRQDRAQVQALQSPRQISGESTAQIPPPQMNQLPSPSQNAQNAPQGYVGQAAGQPNQQAVGERRVAEVPPAVTTTAVSQPARDTSRFSGGGGGGRGGAAALTTLDVPTSTPSTRYRAVNGRNIQRSIDSGVTWTTVRMVAPPTMIVAGASPSPLVCWLAGTGGVVLSTADGLVWRDAKLPEPGEIKSIAAVDANIATVTLTDGRTLITTNAGTSWARPK